MTPLISIRGVETFYGNIRALSGVDLDVYEGEIVTLVGSNGAGKTTLMMTICGDPRARSGQIVFQGQNITNLPTHEIMRLSIAQSPEGRAFSPGCPSTKIFSWGRSLRPRTKIRYRAIWHWFSISSRCCAKGKGSAGERFQAASSKCFR